MNNSRKSNARGFSLIELVIVVVIIGIIGAIAIPRMSRGSAGAADSALIGDLSVLRNAIDLYAAEHNGAFPALGTIGNQLTSLTNAAGAVDDGSGKLGGYIFGPYIRKIPSLPVGSFKGLSTFTDTLATPGFGWVYNATTGVVTANGTVSDKDESGKLYSAF